MAVEEINDTNYSRFRESPQAVLVLSTSTCDFCEEYRPVIQSLSEALPSVRFGDAMLDRGHLMEVKREFPDVIQEGVPATILFQAGDSFGYFMGALDFEKARAVIVNAFEKLAPGQEVAST